MKELNKNELLNIEGGSLINSALISALARGANIFMNAGRYLGSSIRRILSGCLC